MEDMLTQRNKPFVCGDVRARETIQYKNTE